MYSRYAAYANPKMTTLEAAVYALCKCLEAGIAVTVQTVATKKTINDLPSMGEKLFRLGIRSWRVLKVIRSKASMEGYKSLEQENPTRRMRVKDKAYRYVFEQLLSLHRASWQSRMALQVTENERPDSVILVAPDGTFLTESYLKIEKVELDPRNPKNPKIERVLSGINVKAHAERYLNITSQAYRRG
jgi:MoaA/NifB/PqqE/SkfB family radical SAM enzyme